MNIAFGDDSDLTYIDETWNFLNPAGRVPEWQRMKKNIYHFAGNPDRINHIEQTIWDI